MWEGRKEGDESARENNLGAKEKKLRRSKDEKETGDICKESTTLLMSVRRLRKGWKTNDRAVKNYLTNDFLRVRERENNIYPFAPPHTHATRA